MIGLGLVFLMQGNAYAQISAVLSLSTNVLATSLIAYKTWYVLAMPLPCSNAFLSCRHIKREHRQLMKQHFAEEVNSSRVLKVLALLIESGCIYCALLVRIILYRTLLHGSQ